MHGASAFAPSVALPIPNAVDDARTSARIESVVRVLAYVWFVTVMSLTGFLPDLKPVLRFRGWLVRGCFRNCGRNFQIASGVRINYTRRMTVGDNVYVAPGCWINAYGGLRLDDEVMLGPYTVVATSNHTKHDGSYRFGAPASAPVVIGRGAWTGSHTTITSGTRIGHGTAVAAGAVVTKSVPHDAVVAGVPARVIQGNEAGRQPVARPAVVAHTAEVPFTAPRLCKGVA